MESMLSTLFPPVFLMVFLLTGYLIGLDEGMTMLQKDDYMSTKEGDGVRNHINYFWYHGIGCIERLLLVVVGVFHAYWFLSGYTFILPLGGWVLLWATLEMGYGKARVDMVFPPWETIDFVFADATIKGTLLKRWRYTRIGIGVVLSVIGAAYGILQ